MGKQSKKIFFIIDLSGQAARKCRTEYDIQTSVRNPSSDGPILIHEGATPWHHCATLPALVVVLSCRWRLCVSEKIGSNKRLVLSGVGQWGLWGGCTCRNELKSNVAVQGGFPTYRVSTPCGPIPADPRIPINIEGSPLGCLHIEV